MQAAIDAELDAHPTGALAAASAALSDDYARGRPSAVGDARQHAAYLGARLPATFAAVSATLAMVPDDVLDRVQTMLDLGAGPGTATLAAHDRCRRLTASALVDRSAALLGVARRLASSAGIDRALAITTRIADIGARQTWPAADLVVAAYALPELPAGGRAALFDSAWKATTLVLVLVEPGTPAGFAHLHEARERALAAGAHVIAPCPHAHACPMQPRAGADWCHFAVRVPRTRRHRQLKGGTLGYEDEKFACLVVSREPMGPSAPARVLRHSRVEKGRIGLTLCTPDGIARVDVTRRDADYRAARKVGWGDAWNVAPGTPAGDD